MLLIDRENLFARGWSHVLSSTNDIVELEAFRLRIGAPRRALQLGNRRRPHLDLRLGARARALAAGDVLVFERTTELLRYWRGRQLWSVHTTNGSGPDR